MRDTDSNLFQIPDIPVAPYNHRARRHIHYDMLLATAAYPPHTKETQIVPSGVRKGQQRCPLSRIRCRLLQLLPGVEGFSIAGSTAKVSSFRAQEPRLGAVLNYSDPPVTKGFTQLYIFISFQSGNVGLSCYRRVMDHEDCRDLGFSN